MKTIGVFFGSRSPEHDVSIITGQLIIAGLKDLPYQVVPVYLDKNGRWFLGGELGKVEYYRQGCPGLEKYGGFQLDLQGSVGKMVFRRPGLFGKQVVIDLAFPAFHGRNGEDGTIQGLFELCNLPYVGCDVTSSAVTMDKVLTKLLYQKFGLPTVDFVFFEKRDWLARQSEILQEIKTKLKWPLFVKPARLGSSIGISKTENEKDLIFAIEVALHYDEKVLVENGVSQLVDITCAVLGTDNPQPSLLQESVFASGFFSYEEKYLKGGGAQLGKAENSIIIPARLDEKTTKQIREMAVQIFKLAGCSGIARVDFLYDKADGKFYANEINTLPGTLYHHLWLKSGIEFKDLLSKLIGFAEERHARQEEFVSRFESDILKQSERSGKLNVQSIRK